MRTLALERKLVVNEAEAATVRYIFRRYLELGAVRALRDDLAAAGVVSKRRTAADGSPYGGHRFSRGALYLMFQKRPFVGRSTQIALDEAIERGQLPASLPPQPECPDHDGQQCQRGADPEIFPEADRYASSRRFLHHD